jgi:hypothetical protein
MAQAYPNSAISGYAPLIPEMANHPKDRHVLAAAVHGGCDLIVTANLRDFPDTATRPYGIGVVHPDTFLSDLWHAHRDQALAAIQREVASYKAPPLSVAGFARNLTPVVPRFAHLIVPSQA